MDSAKGFEDMMPNTNVLSSHHNGYWEASGDYFQHQWNHILAFYNGDPYNIFVYGSIYGSLLLYWTVSLLYFFLNTSGLLNRYKIQQGSNHSFNKVAILKVFLMVNFNLTVVTFLTFHVCWKAFLLRGYNQSVELPSLPRIIIELIISLLFNEVTFYYGHRLLHHRIMYKRFHKLHHDWQAPIAIAAVYAHPIEHILANLLPILVGPLLLGSHLSVILLFSMLIILLALNNHSGYNLPFTILSPEAHDYHHLKFNESFGVIGIMDYIHGTSEGFRKSKNFKRNSLFPSFNPPIAQFPDETTDKKFKSH